MTLEQETRGGAYSTMLLSPHRANWTSTSFNTAVTEWHSSLHACVEAKGDHFEHKLPGLKKKCQANFSIVAF